MKYTARQYAAALFTASQKRPEEEQKQIVDAFFALLQKNRALKLLPSILRLYTQYAREQHNVLGVTVTTARAFPHRELEHDLSLALKAPVELTAHIEPEILGGAIVRVGDTLLDGSVRERLAQLRSTLASTTAGH